jgi:hypothetical protein
VRIVYDGVAVESAAEAARRIGHSPRQLESSVFVEGADPAFTCKCLGAEAEVQIVERRANRWRLRAAMGQERGYLVLADAWSPGWVAEVDGERVPLLPANLAFRAVALAEGEHDIELRYVPWSVTLGLPLLGFGLVLLVGLSLAFCREP